ncbi:hypothetical protein Dimus_029900 [Dionaea muscipula]
MCVMSQHRHPVDLADVNVFWRFLTVGDEEGVHGVHEDPEIPNALRLIDESLEVIKKANPDQQMFYAHAIHSLIHPESIEVEELITRFIKLENEFETLISSKSESAVGTSATRASTRCDTTSLGLELDTGRSLRGLMYSRPPCLVYASGVAGIPCRGPFGVRVVSMVQTRSGFDAPAGSSSTQVRRTGRQPSLLGPMNQEVGEWERFGSTAVRADGRTAEGWSECSWWSMWSELGRSRLVAPGTAAVVLPPEEIQGRSFDRFVSAHPPKFTGTPDAIEASNWLMEVEEILQRIGCLPEHRVSHATFML